MILVDTSVWIEFFSSSPGLAGRALRRLIAESEPVALTGIVVAEVLQGLTRDVEVIDRYLSQWEILESRGLETYRAAARIFRLARSRGITPTTIDAIITAIALENGARIFSLDQDFTLIASLVPLGLYSLE